MAQGLEPPSPPPVGAGAGGLGQSPQILLFFRQLTASIAFSPLTKIHQAALAHRFCSSIGGGPRTQS